MDRISVISSHLIPSQCVEGSHNAGANSGASTAGPAAARAPTGEVDFDRALRVSMKLAEKAGELIRDAFHKSKSPSQKGAFDFVTETDKLCEQLILGGLRKKFPQAKLIGEESSGDTAQLTDAPTFFVDPLDGTTNFIHGFPYVGVSIGLAVKKRPVMGVVFAPLYYEMFSAVQGRGACLNGKPIRSSQATRLDQALLATGMPKQREHLPQQQAVLNAILVRGRAHSIRCNGSAALDLCGVASGRLDAYLELSGISGWDVCAGTCILQEAGGYACDVTGAGLDLMSHRCLAASSQSLTEAVVQCLQTVTQVVQPVTQVGNASN